MKRSTRIADLPVGMRGQVISLRKGGMAVNDICRRLGIEKSSERNAVSEICAEPGLRAYGHSIEVGGPVKGRGYARRVAV